LVVQYNKNSNGTKEKKEKKTMAMQCQYRRTYMYTIVITTFKNTIKVREVK